MSHGHTTHSWQSPTYQSWAAMLQRCRNPNAINHSYYGGKGVGVCERWHSFENFLADMGEKPNGLTLDRKDNNKNYEPENCRWTTRKEQTLNRSYTKLDERKAHQIRWLTEMGYSQRQIARMYGVSRRTVRNVIEGKNWAVG